MDRCHLESRATALPLGRVARPRWASLQPARSAPPQTRELLHREQRIPGWPPEGLLDRLRRAARWQAEQRYSTRRPLETRLTSGSPRLRAPTPRTPAMKMLPVSCLHAPMALPPGAPTPMPSSAARASATHRPPQRLTTRRPSAQQHRSAVSLRRCGCCSWCPCYCSGGLLGQQGWPTGDLGLRMVSILPRVLRMPSHWHQWENATATGAAKKKANALHSSQVGTAVLRQTCPPRTAWPAIWHAGSAI
mmetsp:Transcript_24041/g.67495  ORF Transcript_24041/g.67495 Transcript_24041/m.67495 type:complete len:248 (-) Transcript_24041:73-816(-)